MSIEKLSQTPAGTTDFTSLKAEVTKNAKGMSQVSLSNYDNDSAPVVKVGSVFENNGATFIVSGTDETPAGYAGISVSTTFYLYFHYDSVTPANSEFQYSSTAPVWNDALQGWYNGNDRAFFSMFKDSGGALYESKALILSKSSNRPDGIITHNNTVKWKYYYEKDSSDLNTDIYDNLKEWVPSVGDSMAVYGFYQVSSVDVSLLGIYRDTSTTIKAIGFRINSASAQTQTALATFTEGEVTSTRIKLMSNFDVI